MKRILLPLILAVALSPIPAKAINPGDFYSPFGTSPVTVRVGYHSASNSTYIFWQRKSDGTCFTNQIGGATVPATTNSIFVYGSPGNDDMVVLPWNDTFTCTGAGSFTLSPPTYYNGIFLFGQAGNDVVQGGNGVGNHGSLKLYGGDGNDLLFNYGPNTSLYGGNGNDVLWTNSGGAYVLMYGEGGDDCLDMTSAPTTPNEIWCGAGTDRIAPTWWRGTDCEIQTTSCL